MILYDYARISVLKNTIFEYEQDINICNKNIDILNLNYSEIEMHLNKFKGNVNYRVERAYSFSSSSSGINFVSGLSDRYLNNVSGIKYDETISSYRRTFEKIESDINKLKHEIDNLQKKINDCLYEIREIENGQLST